jgi:hypothetical protein
MRTTKKGGITNVGQPVYMGSHWEVKKLWPPREELTTVATKGGGGGNRCGATILGQVKLAMRVTMARKGNNQ